MTFSAASGYGGPTSAAGAKSTLDILEKMTRDRRFAVFANDIQVGGTHYKNAMSYEHWDWVLAVGLGYLEAQAARYVVRWRRKDGAEGLRKALHFINKIDENRARALCVANRAGYEVIMTETGRFAEANVLTPLERRFMERMATWREPEDLVEARETLFRLLDEAEGPPAPAPVPLTDSNRHADRAGVPHGPAPQD